MSLFSASDGPFRDRGRGVPPRFADATRRSRASERLVIFVSTDAFAQNTAL